MNKCRALHFVLRTGSRVKSINFFKNVLQMKVLRHEEFKEGCEAACNGPYDGVWSKTMIGYGSEDTHFVVELTYNYGIGKYQNGNDFLGLTISEPKLYEQIINGSSKYERITATSLLVYSPCGYKFIICNKTSSTNDPIVKCSLSCTDLSKSLNYWTELCDMQLVDKTDNSFICTFNPNQCNLELIKITTAIDRGTAYGRIAFSAPTNLLPIIENKMKSANKTILKSLVSLPTPGKATVQVVILADPDGHEICFVGDEAYRELSIFDPKGDQLLTDAIKNDKSEEWFAKKVGQKPIQ